MTSDAPSPSAQNQLIDVWPPSTRLELKIEHPASKVWDFGTYAPAVPGVVVALAAIFIAHTLTKSRERRKELAKAFEDMKSEAADACECASSGWMEEDEQKRIAAISQTKSRLQSLGRRATLLDKRLDRLFWRNRVRSRWVSTDILGAVAKLRTACTDDPFEEPGRTALSTQTRDIYLALAEVNSSIDNAIWVIECPPICWTPQH